MARGKTKPAGFPAFDELVARVRSDSDVERWDQIQDEFLAAVSLFDTEYSKGRKNSGWYQKKAGYFNDLLVLLLENATGAKLGRSVKRGSALFDEIDINLCYPEDPTRRPSVGAEAKMLGAPPHPGNKNIARSARQDIHKRVREVALTSVDFKAHYAPARAIHSFKSWIAETRPKYFSFWAFRVADAHDFENVRQIMNALKNYCNGVGAFFYRERLASEPTLYEPAPASELNLDGVLKEMAFEIANETAQ